MRRFYCLTVQPTLFGGASLIRDWGRIGTRGRTMIETFDKANGAEKAFDRLERTKRRRGYRDADIRKLLGNNLLRTWATVEAGAGK